MSPEIFRKKSINQQMCSNYNEYKLSLAKLRKMFSATISCIKKKLIKQQLVIKQDRTAFINISKMRQSRSDQFNGHQISR